MKIKPHMPRRPADQAAAPPPLQPARHRCQPTFHVATCPDGEPVYFAVFGELTND